MNRHEQTVVNAAREILRGDPRGRVPVLGLQRGPLEDPATFLGRVAAKHRRDTAAKRRAARSRVKRARKTNR